MQNCTTCCVGVEVDKYQVLIKLLVYHNTCCIHFPIELQKYV